MNIEKHRKANDVRTFLKGREKDLLEKMILENLYIIHDKKFSYQTKQKTWDLITEKFNKQSEIKKNRQQIRKWYKNNRSHLLSLNGFYKTTKTDFGCHQDFSTPEPLEAQNGTTRKINHKLNDDPADFKISHNSFSIDTLTKNHALVKNRAHTDSEQIVFLRQKKDYDIMEVTDYQDPDASGNNVDIDFEPDMEDVADEDYVGQSDNYVEQQQQQSELMRLRIEHERLKIFETRKRIEVINLQKLYWKQQINLQGIATPQNTTSS